MKNNRPAYKELHSVFIPCVRRYMGNVVFSLFLYTFIRTVLYTVFMLPFSKSLLAFVSGEDSASLTVKVLIVFVLLCAFLCDCILCYGIFVMCARMAKRERVTLGYMFYGFKKNNIKRAFWGAFLFLVWFAIFGALLYTVFYFNAERIESFIESCGIQNAIMYGSPLVLLALLVFLIPFSFFYTILYSKIECNVFICFIKSLVFVFKNFFHFIGYVIFSAGINLPLFIIYTLLGFWIPGGEDTSSVMNLAGMFFSFASFFSEIVVIVRTLLCIPVYFYALEARNSVTVEA